MNRRLSLRLNEPVDVEGGRIAFTDSISHPGQQIVARFDATIGDRERNVELRVGDVAQAGDVAFEVCEIAPERGGATVEIHALERGDLRAAPGDTFTAKVGTSCSVAGRIVHLTALGHYGVEALFTESNGVDNFAWFDFGFWRCDDLLFEVDSIDTEQRTCQMMVSEETTRNRSARAAFGVGFWLSPLDEVTLDDDTTIRLRRAARQCYDSIEWNLLAERGDDIAYPWTGTTTTGAARRVHDRSFRLMNRKYELLADGLRLEPELALRLTIRPETVARFALGEPFELATSTALQGPDGLLVRYQGSAHAHGTMLDADGDETPFTDAWADFAIVKGNVTEHLTVDLTTFEEPVTIDALGYSFTFLDIGEHRARVQVHAIPK